jgi:hypothetical protein
LQSNTQVLQNSVDPKSPICYNNSIDSKQGATMQYTLITGKGKVYTFFIRAVAEQFQQAYGGVVITQQILQNQQVVAQ